MALTEEEKAAARTATWFHRRSWSSPDGSQV